MARKLTKAIEIELDVIYQGRKLILKVWPTGVLGLRLKRRRAMYVVDIIDLSFTGLKVGDLKERKENRKLKDIIMYLLGIFQQHCRSIKCDDREEAMICHRLNEAAAAIGLSNYKNRRPRMRTGGQPKTRTKL